MKCNRLLALVTLRGDFYLSSEVTIKIARFVNAKGRCPICRSRGSYSSKRTHVASGRLTRYTRARGSINGGC